MMACDCINRINAALRPDNTELLIMFYPSVRPIVATQKVDTRKRGKPKVVAPSFCPFCGIGFDPVPAMPAKEVGPGHLPGPDLPNSEAPLPDGAGETAGSKPDAGTNPTGPGD